MLLLLLLSLSLSTAGRRRTFTVLQSIVDFVAAAVVSSSAAVTVCTAFGITVCWPCDLCVAALPLLPSNAALALKAMSIAGICCCCAAWRILFGHLMSTRCSAYGVFSVSVSPSVALADPAEAVAAADAAFGCVAALCTRCCCCDIAADTCAVAVVDVGVGVSPCVLLVTAVRLACIALSWRIIRCCHTPVALWTNCYCCCLRMLSLTSRFR